MTGEERAIAACGCMKCRRYPKVEHLEFDPDVLTCVRDKIATAIDEAVFAATGGHDHSHCVTAERRDADVTDALKASWAKTRALLEAIRDKFIHEPDSDAQQWCIDCRRHPYASPAHAEDCLVPRVRAALDGYYVEDGP